MELDRTAQIQPGVYFTFEAPFLRILALYSNVSEQAGIISSPDLSDAQLKFLEAAFRRIKIEQFQGAVIIAVHHDMVGAGGSPEMLSKIDSISQETGVLPHLVLSGHAHNYQRFTRKVNFGGTPYEIPYVVAGTGGGDLNRFKPANARFPELVLRHFNDQQYGYLRLTVGRKQLHMDFQTVEGHTSKVSDTFTLDLASRRLMP